MFAIVPDIAWANIKTNNLSENRFGHSHSYFWKERTWKNGKRQASQCLKSSWSFTKVSPWAIYSFY